MAEVEGVGEAVWADCPMGGEGGLEVEHGVRLDKGIVHHMIDPLAVKICSVGGVYRLEANGKVEAEDLAMFLR